MSHILNLHRQAMDMAEAAFVSRLNGDFLECEVMTRRAYELEREAAEHVADHMSAEPTRSVLLRSAASLAVECAELAEAERLIGTALAGYPPDEIREELLDLLEQVSFQRHLDVRGVELDPTDLQLSIAGNAVGYGMAQSDVFVARVQDTEKLIVRTGERRRGKPFRYGGRPSLEIIENTELYVTVPRAASFAVSFRVGHRKKQLSFAETDESVGIVGEVMDCLELFGNGDTPALRHRIEDEAYYNNFVGLAQRISPDGNAVDLVGFTAVCDGEERRVALRKPREEVIALATPAESPADAKRVTITGTLRFASALESSQQIKVVDEKGRSHKIIVPEGMLDDIVKPLWNNVVVVEGVQVDRLVRLQHIQPASD